MWCKFCTSRQFLTFNTQCINMDFFKVVLFQYLLVTLVSEDQSFVIVASNPWRPDYDLSKNMTSSFEVDDV